VRAGAGGFLLKDVPPRELVRAVRVVLSGEALLAPTVPGACSTSTSNGRDRLQAVVLAYESGLVRPDRSDRRTFRVGRRGACWR
jgi:DNA-binding NarL/FixJ family response regulator